MAAMVKPCKVKRKRGRLVAIRLRRWIERTMILASAGYGFWA